MREAKMRTIPRDRRQSDGIPDRGYLMIEIMTAMAVFAIGFLALGSVVIATTRNNTTANIVTRATMLAMDQLERLKAQAIPDMTGGTDHQGIYTRTWTVTDTLGSGTSRRIDVTVSWERMGQARRVVLSTISKGNGT
jgi:Tfp pilus assembly protein PilV